MNETLKTYRDLVLEKNKVLNLTAMTDPIEFEHKSIQDSLKLLEFHTFNKGDKVMDLGTGAGLPGIPLAIMQPEINMTLVDARKKKVIFLQEMIQALNLRHVQAVAARAEELGRDKKYRGAYDAIVTRALAPLNVLLEYSIPLLKIGGLLFAYKGPKAIQELQEAKEALKQLKTSYLTTFSYNLLNAKLSILVFQKKKATSKEYPRSPGTPSKKPL